MAITKILNIMESEGRNPATHLKNALEYIQKELNGEGNFVQ